MSRYSELKTAGLCVTCGIVPADDPAEGGDGRRCAECIAERKLASGHRAGRRAAFIANSLCGSCGAQRAPGDSTYCAKHRMELRAAKARLRQRLIDKGICVWCHKSPIAPDNKQYCPDCRIKHRQSLDGK